MSYSGESSSFIGDRKFLENLQRKSLSPILSRNLFNPDEFQFTPRRFWRYVASIYAEKLFTDSDLRVFDIANAIISVDLFFLNGE